MSSSRFNRSTAGARFSGSGGGGLNTSASYLPSSGRFAPHNAYGGEAKKTLADLRHDVETLTAKLTDELHISHLSSPAPAHSHSHLRALPRPSSGLRAHPAGGGTLSQDHLGRLHDDMVRLKQQQEALDRTARDAARLLSPSRPSSNNNNTSQYGNNNRTSGGYTPYYPSPAAAAANNNNTNASAAQQRGPLLPLSSVYPQADSDQQQQHNQSQYQNQSQYDPAAFTAASLHGNANGSGGTDSSLSPAPHTAAASLAAAALATSRVGELEALLAEERAARMALQQQAAADLARAVAALHTDLATARAALEQEQARIAELRVLAKGSLDAREGQARYLRELEAEVQAQQTQHAAVLARAAAAAEAAEANFAAAAADATSLRAENAVLSDRVAVLAAADATNRELRARAEAAEQRARAAEQESAERGAEARLLRGAGAAAGTREGDLTARLREAERALQETRMALAEREAEAAVERRARGRAEARVHEERAEAGAEHARELARVKAHATVC